ncbi:MAG: thrombospondin type 3 repeat-containing protein [Patescibacteria group bacterium]|nr:thrombospondin type 3 repeat-containing protein [Patescibacteria group bacterium]
MKKTLIYFSLFLLFASPTFAQIYLGEKLKGRILLSVEENGEAWYIPPSNFNRYFLGRPTDAFNILKNLGVGITNTDLEKIPTGIIKSNELDSDGDGLSDNLEIAIGTDIHNRDSDNDGHWDETEIIALFNPMGTDPLNIDLEFTKNNLGKIFIQTEKNGEAWYVDPVSQKKYYLSRPKIAFEIMRQFGLGITIRDLEKINIGQIPETIVLEINPPVISPPIKKTNGRNVIDDIANAIRAKNVSKTKSLFIPEMSMSLEYSLNNMPDESILLLGNLLSGASLDSSSSTKLTYKNTVYFNGENHDVYFNVEKQEDGEWLMTNL